MIKFYECLKDSALTSKGLIYSIIDDGKSKNSGIFMHHLNVVWDCSTFDDHFKYLGDSDDYATDGVNLIELSKKFNKDKLLNKIKKLKKRIKRIKGKK